MKSALVRHHGLLQQAIESAGGYVFQIVGDAFAKGELSLRLNQLGGTALAHGDVARAARFFRQAIARAREPFIDLPSM